MRKTIWFGLLILVITSSCQRNEIVNSAFIGKSGIEYILLNNDSLYNDSNSFYFYTDALPLLTHFKQEKKNNNILKLTEIFDGRILYLRAGELYLFDGSTEEQLFADYFINDFELAADKRNIYVCGQNKIGIFGSTEDELFVYRSIATNDVQNPDFDKIVRAQNYIYFISSHNILTYSPRTRKIVNYFSFPLGYNKSNAFSFRQKLYVNVYPKGILEFDSCDFIDPNIKYGDYNYALQKIENNSISDYEIVEFVDYEFVAKFSDSLMLLSQKDSLMLFDGYSLARLDIGNSDFIQNTVPQNAVSLNDSILAVGTLNKGIFFIDKNNGKDLINLNINGGLLHETISSMYFDSKNGLWIITPKSLSRAHYDLPVKKLEHHNIINGQILCMNQFDSVTYFGTTEGVFRKKFVQDTNKINLVFERISGVEKQIFQFIEFEKSILAISNNSVYKIDSLEAKKIIDLKIIRSVRYLQEYQMLLLATSQGLYFYSDSLSVLKKVGENLNLDIYSMNVSDGNVVWLGLKDRVLYAKIDSSGIPERFYSYEFRVKQKQKIEIFSDSIGNIFYSQDHFYRIENNEFVLDSLLENMQITLVFNSSEIFAKSLNSMWHVIDNEKNNRFDLSYLNLFENINSLMLENKNTLLVSTNNNQLYSINIDSEQVRIRMQSTIYKILNTDNQTIPLNNTKISAFSEGVRFFFSSPFFYQKSGVHYQYFIEGLSSNWSSWSTQNFVEIPFLPTGNYTFYYRAKNIFNKEGRINKHTIKVEVPFYAQTWFLLLIFSLLIIVVALIVYWFMHISSDQIKEQNKYLERRINERTDDLRKKQAELTDSINYASRIQNAILPKLQIFEQNNFDYFIVNRPKNIVSGDFYWVSDKQDYLSIAVVDCTGHGVPGAFMSILGLTLLSQINRLKEGIKPDEVLEELRAEVIDTLNQHGKEHEIHDGMDMALIHINKKRDKISFAGAYRPLYLIRNKELIVYKGQRMPVGLFIRKSNFTYQDIELEKGDVVYLFSDGYADQTGGVRASKFSTKQLKKLLIEISEKPLAQQKIILETEMDNWKKNYSQVDDILVMGIKV